MTRYEPHCDCLGGHVSMVPDPNGRWCRADDPRAVADDPSGIVQQMPETVGGDALKPCPFCGGTARVYGPVGWYRQYCISHSCSVFYGGSGDFTVGSKTKEQAIAAWNRRATEADLRAEVERLRSALKSIAKVKYGLQGIMEDHSDANAYNYHAMQYWAKLAARYEMQARAALSPETDGGQDAPADS